MSTRAARDSSPGFFFPLARLRGPATRRHSAVSDDVPPPRRRDDRDAERRVFLVFFVVGHSDGIFRSPRDDLRGLVAVRRRRWLRVFVV